MVLGSRAEQLLASRKKQARQCFWKVRFSSRNVMLRQAVKLVQYCSSLALQECADAARRHHMTIGIGEGVADVCRRTAAGIKRGKSCTNLRQYLGAVNTLGASARLWTQALASRHVRQAALCCLEVAAPSAVATSRTASQHLANALRITSD